MKKRTAKIWALILTAVFLLCGIPVSAHAAMSDINGHWGQAAIQYCLDHGYMSGVSKTSFQPNGTVTRAQVVQVLYNMSGAPNTNGLPDPFADSQSHWANKAIQWASDAGVVYGISSTAFAPDRSVTRDQVTTMFKRYADQDRSNTYNDFTLDSSALNRFSDKDKVASWYLDGITWAVQYGFMQGSNGKLNPTGKLTRAQLAQFIKNYYEPIGGGNPTPTPIPTPTPTPTPPPVTQPYQATTLVRAELRYSYAESLMALDGQENLVYYDTRSRALYRLRGNEAGTNKRETLLDAETATCTVTVEGTPVTYTDLQVTQVFYDNVADRLILQGEFTSIDTSANGGWWDPDAPDRYKGAFTLKNGRLELLMTYRSAQAR